VYGARGATFVLLVVFLRQGLGYSPIAAGAAALPVTLILLLLSARTGALAQRIGPRLPMTLGPLLAAVGIALMARISADSTYVLDVLPALLVFGLGLALTVAPLTATVLGAAEDRYAGIASGVNNAVARTAGLIAVAALPPLAGLSGSAFQDPTALAAGFRTAMLLSAALCVAGGIIAWLT